MVSPDIAKVDASACMQAVYVACTDTYSLAKTLKQLCVPRGAIGAMSQAKNNT